MVFARWLFEDGLTGERRTTLGRGVGPILVEPHTDWLSELAFTTGRLELTLTVEGPATHRREVENEVSYQLQRGAFWTDFTAYPRVGSQVIGTPERMLPGLAPSATAC